MPYQNVTLQFFLLFDSPINNKYVYLVAYTIIHNFEEFPHCEGMTLSTIFEK